MLPRVSVIIIAFNREAMIKDAISSILAQTMTDFELIVVDDGSTDRTAEITGTFVDPRLRLIVHERNLGIPQARNTGLSAARGRYIAWLDSDDLARPARLAIQADHLDNHPDVALIGGQGGTINPDGRRSWIPRPKPITHEQIVPMLLFRSALLQSSIMGRGAIMKRYPYRLDFPVSQDLDMFIRLSSEHRVGNLPTTVVDRRVHSGQVVKQRADLIIDRKRVLFRDLLGRLGIDPSDEELDRHIMLGRIGNRPVDRLFLEWGRRWLEKIVAANRSRRIYDEAGLAYAVRWVWWRACGSGLAGPNPVHALAEFFRSPR